MRQTILVTGAAGYIGSAICHRLLEEGFRVKALDSMVYGCAGAIPRGTQAVKHDLREPVVCLDDVDAVIHAAAESLIPRSFEMPDLYYEVNVVAAVKLLQAMRQAGVPRLIYTSTSSVYRPSGEPLSENAPLDPLSPYAETKYLFERALHLLGRRMGIGYTIFRFFNVAGATEHVWEWPYHQTRLIPMCLRVASGELPYIPIYGRDYDTPDGTCIRDYVHVADVAEAHVLALRQPVGYNSDFNLGLGQGHSTAEVVECCQRVTGKPIPSEKQPRRINEPARLVSSPAKAQQILGWQPRYTTLESIIESAWKFTPYFRQ